MYTIGNLARTEGFKLNAAINGVQVVVVDSAIDPQPTFLALVSATSSIDPSMPMGADLREADAIETLREWLPASMLARSTPSQIKAKIDDTRFVMTKREDNVASPFVRFEVVKLL